MPFTQKEAKKLGMPKDKLDAWENMMKCVFRYTSACHGATQDENDVIVYDFRIGCNIVNSSYLELKIESNHSDPNHRIEYLSMRADSEELVSSVLSSFLHNMK